MALSINNLIELFTKADNRVKELTNPKLHNQKNILTIKHTGIWKRNLSGIKGKLKTIGKDQEICRIEIDDKEIYYTTHDDEEIAFLLKRDIGDWGGPIVIEKIITAKLQVK